LGAMRPGKTIVVQQGCFMRAAFEKIPQYPQQTDQESNHAQAEKCKRNDDIHDTRACEADTADEPLTVDPRILHGGTKGGCRTSTTLRVRISGVIDTLI
jgi:hypothetical protein